MADAVVEQKINVYDGPYHWYLPAFFDYLHRLQLRPLEGRLARGARVLDVGAGDGRLTHFLALRARFVVGLEPQLHAIQLGRLMTQLHRSRPRWCQSVAAPLPFVSVSFDCVTAFDVIEHLPPGDAHDFLIEARRVLRRRGLLLLSTPNRRSLRNRVLGHRLDAKHYFEFAADELREWLDSAGFDIAVFEGVYLAPPLRRIEHFASTFPFRSVFRWLAGLGRRMPFVSERLVALAVRRDAE